MEQQPILQGSINPWPTIQNAMRNLRLEIKETDAKFKARSAVAMNLRGQAQSDLRKTFSNSIMHTEAAQELYRIESNSEKSVEKLAALGYERLRHLRNHGFTFSEISRDFGINIIDIIEFMRLSPTAVEDAIQDEEQCADTRTMKLDHYVRNEPILNKNDVVRLQLVTNIQLEMNKRLSPKWAKGPEDPTKKDEEEKAEQAKIATITMVINNSPETRTIDVTPQSNYEEMEKAGGSDDTVGFSIGLPGE